MGHLLKEGIERSAWRRLGSKLDTHQVMMNRESGGGEPMDVEILVGRIQAGLLDHPSFPLKHGRAAGGQENFDFQISNSKDPT
jgi:hypothetical protein